MLGVCPWLDCFDFVKFVDFSELVVEESSEFLSSLELDESFSDELLDESSAGNSLISFEDYLADL